MRPIKMLGLAMFASIAAMAFLGASSATAGSTLLCENDPVLAGTGCTTPVDPGINQVHFLSVVLNASKLYVGGYAELLTNVGITVKCNVLIQGTISAGLKTNAPVVATVSTTELVYSNCLEGCEVTTLKGGTISVLKTANELGEVTGAGFEVQVKCGVIINCIYGAVGLIGHGLGALTSGNPDNRGHVTFAKAPVKKVRGPLCPTATLDATFASLRPLHIKA